MFIRANPWLTSYDWRFPKSGLESLVILLLAAPNFDALFQPGLAAAVLLSTVLLMASILAWTALPIRAQTTGTVELEWCDEPRSDWKQFPELTVVLLVLLLISMFLLPKLEPLLPKSAVPTEVETVTAEPARITMNGLLFHAAFTGGLGAVLIGILTSSQRPLADYGLKLKALRRQVMDGVFGYLLALLPMAAFMLATSPFRNRENRNGLLTLLAEHPDVGTIAAICFTAVILAPLYEELLFRVVLQGWLTSFINPRYAIPFVAFVFGAIHGMPDGIALLPLAGVLGYVFYRRHSYVSVLVIHGLFNGTMLILAVLTQNE